VLPHSVGVCDCSFRRYPTRPSPKRLGSFRGGEVAPDLSRNSPERRGNPARAAAKIAGEVAAFVAVIGIVGLVAPKRRAGDKASGWDDGIGSAFPHSLVRLPPFAGDEIVTKVSPRRPEDAKNRSRRPGSAKPFLALRSGEGDYNPQCTLPCPTFASLLDAETRCRNRTWPSPRPRVLMPDVLGVVEGVETGAAGYGQRMIHCDIPFSPVSYRDGYLRLEDHGLVGDGTTAALVGRDGCVDWLCLPRFDALWGASSALIGTGVAFVLAAVCVLPLRSLPGSGRPPHDTRPTGLWRGTVEGVRFVYRDPLLLPLTVLVALIVALYYPVEGVILPVYFTGVGAPERLGMLLMVMSGGIVVGTLSYERLVGWMSRRLLCSLCMVGATLSLVWMAFLPGFGQLLAAGALSGIFWGPVGPLLNHAMQLRTPHHLRGRVVGTTNSAALAAGPAGFLAVGLLVEAVGTRPAFIGLAVGLFAVVVAALPWRPWRLLDADPVPGSAASDHPVASRAAKE